METEHYLKQEDQMACICHMILPTKQLCFSNLLAPVKRYKNVLPFHLIIVKPIREVILDKVVYILSSAATELEVPSSGYLSYHVPVT